MWKRAKSEELRVKSKRLRARSKKVSALRSMSYAPHSMVLKDLSIFEITEKTEEATNSVSHGDVAEKLELLKAEMSKLGKAQTQTRVFSEYEHRALRETIEALSTDNDRVAEIMIEDLFSIADGLEAGIRACDEISNPETVSWLDGMKIVHQRVMELLEKFDIHPLHSVGEIFDPSLHTAVAVEHVEETDDNIILGEQRCGYVRGDKVIRYAEVVVNKRSYESAVQMEENNE